MERNLLTDQTPGSNDAFHGLAKGRNLDSPVKAKRGEDCWQKLIHTLEEAGSGKFLVTVHNGQLVKTARIDREVNISQMPHPEDKIPGP